MACPGPGWNKQEEKMIAARTFGPDEWDLVLTTGGQALNDTIARFYDADEFASVGYGLVAVYRKGELLGFFNGVGNPEFVQADDCTVTMYLRELMPALKM
jgi:hypothetical protein